VDLALLSSWTTLMRQLAEIDALIADEEQKLEIMEALWDTLCNPDSRRNQC